MMVVDERNRPLVLSTSRAKRMRGDLGTGQWSALQYSSAVHRRSPRRSRSPNPAWGAASPGSRFGSGVSETEGSLRDRTPLSTMQPLDREILFGGQCKPNDIVHRTTSGPEREQIGPGAHGLWRRPTTERYLFEATGPVSPGYNPRFTKSDAAADSPNRL